MTALKSILNRLWQQGPMRHPLIASAFDADTTADLIVGILINLSLVGLAVVLSIAMTFQQCVIFCLAALALKLVAGK